MPSKAFDVLQVGNTEVSIKPGSKFLKDGLEKGAKIKIDPTEEGYIISLKNWTGSIEVDHLGHTVATPKKVDGVDKSKETALSPFSPKEAPKVESAEDKEVYIVDDLDDLYSDSQLPGDDLEAELLLFGIVEAPEPAKGRKLIGQSNKVDLVTPAPKKKAAKKKKADNGPSKKLTTRQEIIDLVDSDEE